MNQDFAQETTLAGGGNTSTTGFATGAKCTASGTYYTENKYLKSIIVMAAGDAFPPGLDGKKTTWNALTPQSSSARGSFTSVKVAPGEI